MKKFWFLIKFTPPTQTKGCDSNTYDKYHTTPLMTAARNDDVINMEILIQHGVSVLMSRYDEKF